MKIHLMGLLCTWPEVQSAAAKHQNTGGPMELPTSSTQDLGPAPPAPPPGMHNPGAEKSAVGEGCSSILVSASLGFTADDALQTAQAPSSYQGIFEIHESSVIHGEPPLLESFCLLKSQEVTDYTPK